jgi:hypothetical protein
VLQYAATPNGPATEPLLPTAPATYLRPVSRPAWRALQPQVSQMMHQVLGEQSRNIRVLDVLPRRLPVSRVEDAREDLIPADEDLHPPPVLPPARRPVNVLDRSEPGTDDRRSAHLVIHTPSSANVIPVVPRLEDPDIEVERDSLASVPPASPGSCTKGVTLPPALAGQLPDERAIEQLTGIRHGRTLVLVPAPSDRQDDAERDTPQAEPGKRPLPGHSTTPIIPYTPISPDDHASQPHRQDGASF